MMAMANKGKFSNEKGKRFERKVRIVLTEATGREFFRVPRSGGLITSMPILKELGGFANIFRGDLFAKGLAFLIELKSRSTRLKVGHLLGGYGDIFNWWQEAVDESHDILMPMLIFQGDNRKQYCMVDEDGFNVLFLGTDIEYIYGNFRDKKVFVISIDYLSQKEIVDRLFVENIDVIPKKYHEAFAPRMKFDDV